VIIFTGELDRTIAPESAQIILDRIGSKFKQHHHLCASGHCVILDRELDDISQRVLTLIKNGFDQSDNTFA